MHRLTAILLLAASTGLAEPYTLPQLIERARNNDHRVKEAQAQLRWFKAKYQEARWAWFPKIDSYALVGGPTPEAKNDGLGGPPTTKASYLYDLDFGQPGVMFRAGAQAVLPIYTFGKLDALEEAGRQGVQAGVALATRAQDESEFQVAQAYYGYCLANSMKDVIGETIKRLDDARVTLDRLRAQGSEQVTQMDIYKLEYYKKQLEVQVVAADAGARFALAAIRLLIGEADDVPVQVAAEPLSEPSGFVPPMEILLSTARAHRPEIRAIEAGIAAREQEVIIRERMYLPDFGIAGFFRWAWTTNATRQVSPFAYDPYNEFTAGVGLVMAYTWDFPQKAAQLEESRAELEKMQHERDLILAGVRLEVEKAWDDTNSALLRAEKQGSAEKSSRRWAQTAFTAFDVGTGDTRELVDSFTALALSAAQKFQAWQDVQVGLCSLTKTVGQPVHLVAKADMQPPPSVAPAPK